MARKSIDLTGRRFGKLEVLCKSERTDKAGTYWTCLCDCGKEITTRSDMLRKRGKSDCGCVNQKAKVGEKFGLLTVLRVLEKKSEYRNRSLRLCKCDCGTECEVATIQLTSGGTKSCGCLVRSFDRTRHHQIGDIRPYFWNNIQKGAAKRKIEFDLSPEEAWEIWQEQNEKCALSGMDINLPKKSRDWKQSTASLDRIDSSKPYRRDNVQWVHKKVNLMKNSLDEYEFIQICKMIAKCKS